MGARTSYLRFSAILIFIQVLTSSCALPGNGLQNYLKQCVLPQDQAGTLEGNWRALPIPVAFYAGSFGSVEISDITSAASGWNQFTQASLGQSVIDTGGGRTSSVPKPAQLCQAGIVQGGKFVGNVVIYKDGVWPYTNMPDAIALTSYCLGPSGGQPIPSMYMAIMELNYQNFFVAGKKLPDLRTIVLHEFGHLVGINHSCEATGRTGVPTCSNPSLPVEYFQAVMYPVFGFDSSGLGEVKQNLTSNDQGRANCLYIPGSL